MKLHRPLLGIVAAALMTSAHATTYSFRIYSNGVRPNLGSTGSSVTYATLNPNDKGATTALSGGNLVDVSSASSGVRGTIGKSAGKWYFEMSVDSTEDGYAPCLGITTSAPALSSGAWIYGPGEYTYYGMWGGQLIYGSNTRSNYGSNFVAGDVIGVAVDLDNHQVTFYRNGQSQGVAYSNLPTATYYPFASDAGYSTYSSQMTLNFGQNPFKYSVPSGYNAGWYQ